MNSEILDNINNRVNDLINKGSLFLNKINDIKHWEIFYESSQGINIKIEKGNIKNASTGQIISITIRIFGENGKTGSICCKKLDIDSLKKSINKAVKMMKNSIPNPDFKDLAHPKPPLKKIKPSWNKDTANLEVDDLNEILKEYFYQKKRDGRIIGVSGGLGIGDYRERVVNSNGVDVSNKGTSCSISVEYTLEDIIKGKKENSSGFDFQSYINFKDLSKEYGDIFENAFKQAELTLKKRSIPTKEYEVVLSPNAVNSLIVDTICSTINGEIIYQKRSFLVDKLNEEIASTNLTLIDDPWFENGLSSEMFDVEGTPTKPINIIKEGVLTTYLHNTYTANLFGIESNGHATRSGESPTISIGTYNISISPGTRNSNDIISDIKEGIFFEETYDSPNLTTGEFSGMITKGYIIEDGEIIEALRQAMFGIDLLKFYKKINEISKNVIRKADTYLPYIKISSMKISGEK
ncbi:MAG: TldD/PmbA family protein [Promethearchaeota archaeon]